MSLVLGLYALCFSSLHTNGDSSVHCDDTPSAGTCSIECIGDDCSGGDIHCLPDSACSISCSSDEACKQSTIHANGATDVSVVCADDTADSGESCSELHIDCGSGSCSIACGHCDGVTADTSTATQFQCSGACPLSLQQLAFTAAPTPRLVRSSTMTPTAPSGSDSESDSEPPSLPIMPTPEPTPNPLSDAVGVSVPTTEAINSETVTTESGEVPVVTIENAAASPTALMAPDDDTTDEAKFVSSPSPDDLYILTTAESTVNARRQFQFEDITSFDDWIYIAMGAWAVCCIATGTVTATYII